MRLLANAHIDGFRAYRFQALALSIALIILVIRTPYAFWLPALPFEDGVYFLGFYYSADFWTGISRFYAGYITLIPNFIGWAIARLPIEWRPHALAVVPMVLCAFSSSMFAAPYFRPVIASDMQRLLTSLAISLLPIGDFAIVSLSSYTQWSLLVILTFAILSEPDLDVRKPKAIVLITALITLIWSNPASIMLTPLLAFDIIRRRKAGVPLLVGYSILLVGIVLYCEFGPSGTLTTRSGFLSDTFEGVVQRDIIEGLVGTGLRLQFQYYLPPIAAYLLSAAAVGCIFVIAATDDGLRRPQFFFFAFKCCYLIVAYTLLSTMFRKIGLDGPGARRLTYVPSIIFITLFFSTFVTWAATGNTYKKWICGSAVAAWMIMANLYGNVYYSTSWTDGEALRTFVHSVADAEKSGIAKSFHLERGRWSIDVVTHDRDHK